MSDAAPASAPAEITFRAIVLGVVLGLVMGVANVYLGLTAGMTVSASIPAAVVSMGILRGLFRTGTILENNIVQTIASAGESLAAGIIFTMPALVLAGVWSDFDFLITTLVAITGGLLGVLFMIPLRKPMIVEDEDLVYPEGVACAKVLEAGEAGGSGMRAVFGALGVGVVFKLLVDGLGVLKSSLAWNPAALGTRFFTGITAAPALVGVGYIVGINIAVLVFVGGAISWVVAGPIMAGMGYGGVSVDDPGLVGALKPSLRYMGVGAMVVGGLWSILMIRKGIAQGLRETVSSYRSSMRGDAPVERTQMDMDRTSILLLLAGTAL
ncbi:MAG: oligopeptide transporter, OPT family, partial [Planctomycetota bacterium]|nr:oligopeptide transporter, OPT family [Planctomycetota bacterium]